MAKETCCQSTVPLLICFLIMQEFYIAQYTNKNDCDQIAIVRVKQLHFTVFQPFYNFIKKFSSVTKLRKNQVVVSSQMHSTHAKPINYTIRTKTKLYEI